MTPFEQRLAAIPRTPPPDELRDRILAAARPARRHGFALLLGWVRAILSFPHPLAWGAVGAAWMVIAILNFSGPRGEALYAVTPSGYQIDAMSAQEYLAQIEAERRLILALEAERAAIPPPAYHLNPQDL